MRTHIMLLAWAGAALAAPGLAGQEAARTADPSSAAPAGGSAPAYVVTAARLDGELRVDGRLDEAAWAAASPAGGFVQQVPVEGAPSTQRTEARVLYDGRAVYVGMRMHDTAPDSIAGQLVRRDAAGSYSDWAYVLLDSYNDNRTGFRFAVNPRGVKRDIFHFGDVQEDPSWDAVWDVAVSTDAGGWTAEFRIPFSQLRFNARGGAEQTWGVNFGREIARYEERAFWAPMEPNAGRYVSYAGELRGLRELTPPRRLEVQPYSVARLTRAPGESADPFYRANDVAGSLGADLKYGITSDLTLTATINPDFGQVEADPAEVNLTAFETFLPERRPFFTEGTDIFDFDLGQAGLSGGERLFYSRRIGRAPQRRVNVDGWVDAPTATTILGAGKVSGRAGSAWSLGVLSAATAPERAALQVAGRDSAVAVEPFTQYLAGRAIRDFRGGESALGVVLTSVRRDVDAESGLDFLRREAWAGGVDARHRFGGGRFEASGWVLGSHVSGSQRAMLRTQQSSARYFQRPDASHLALDSARTSLGGLAARFKLAKVSGGNWSWDVSGTVRTPGFEVNDLGYQQSADAATGMGSLRYLQSRPGRLFRSWRAGVETGAGWTLGGERFLTYGVLQGGVRLHSFWNVEGGVARLLPALSVTELRGGPALRVQGRTMWMGGLSTDSRRKVRLALDGTVEAEDGTGGRLLSLAPTVRVRPTTRADFTVGPVLERNVAPAQYVGRASTDEGTQYLFGRLEQTTFGLSARLNYAVTPELSLQLYAQPFVSAGEYGSFTRVGDPRAARWNERFLPHPDGPGFDPGFNVKQFRSNAVLRWEYRPGSTLFVVWSQERNDAVEDGSFALGRDFGRLFGVRGDPRVRPTNVLVIKASYWLGL
jgi:hypothetical protein